MSSYVRVAFLLAGAAAALASGRAPAHAAVTLQASSATVAQQGDSGTICVALIAGGEEVAGTQNDLVWDGGCASLSDTSSCYAAGSHGKQLQGKLLDTRDFTYRALILSLSDVDPMDSGVLYCCRFVSEAPPGECCTISMTGMGASDSEGNAIGALGSPGELCTAAGSGSRGRGGGPVGGDQPLGTSNAAPGGEVSAPAAANAPAAGGPAAPPPAQVLQGGAGPGQVPAGANTPAVASTVEAAPASTPVPRTPAATLAPALAPATAMPALVPATAAATPVVTAAAATPSAAADTPTAVGAGATPTRGAGGTPAAAAAAAVPPADAKGGGWFGCHVGGAASAWPGAVIAALFALAARRARRRETPSGRRSR